MGYDSFVNKKTNRIQYVIIIDASARIGPILDKPSNGGGGEQAAALAAPHER
jgi:hypothetical protein